MDLWSEITVPELYRWLAFRLGLDVREGLDTTSVRQRVTHELGLRGLNGMRYSLVLDEFQNASAEVIEEVRLMSNHLGTEGHWWSILVLAQTPLALKLRGWGYQSFRSRLSVHHHLLPLDLAEARALVHESSAERTWNRDDIELLHRDAGANPARLLQLATRTPRRSTSPRLAAKMSRVQPPVPELGELEEQELDAELVIPDLGGTPEVVSEEEGVIEVGWASDPARPTPPAEVLEPESSPEDLSTENEALAPAASATSREIEVPATPGTEGHKTRLRLESNQPFAPYSQLFTRQKLT
jgi:hypothetical protein